MHDVKNTLLKRRELKLLITADRNPGFAQASEMIVTQFTASPETVVIKAVKSKFGRDTFLIDAYIYDSIQEKERIEPRVKVKEKKV